MPITCRRVVSSGCWALSTKLSEMRVIHLIPNLRRGGAERLVLDVVSELGRRSGIEVIAAVLHPANEYAEDYADIAPVRLSSTVTLKPTARDRLDLREWDELLRRFRPDVIHSHLFAAEVLSHASPKGGTTYVTHFHDPMRQLRPLGLVDLRSRTRLTEWYERRFVLRGYRRCERKLFVAISDAIAGYARRVLPIRLRDHVELLPNAIDPRRFPGRVREHGEGQPIPVGERRHTECQEKPGVLDPGLTRITHTRCARLSSSDRRWS